MFFFFLQNIISILNYDGNFTLLSNFKKPRFIQYFSFYDSIPMVDFEFVESLSPDVDFIQVNCSNFTKICKEKQTKIRPVHELILSDGKSFQYNGDQCAYLFLRFLAEHNVSNFNRTSSNYFPLNPTSFSTFIQQSSGSLIVFLDLYDHETPILQEQLNQIAMILSREQMKKTGYIDCHKYDSFCKKMTIKSTPTIRAYTQKGIEEFHDIKTFANILRFINTAFGISRQSDGELSSTAGIIPSAYNIILNFMKQPNKKMRINEMKKIEGCEFYVMLMKRIIQSGGDIIFSEQEKLKKFWKGLDQKPLMKDQLKTNFNILKLFQMFLPFIPEFAEL